MRTALITGASRGIGDAVTSELAKGGWSTFLVAQHSAGLESASARHNGILGTLAIDLGAGNGSAAQVHQAASEATSALDLVVLSAGIFIEESLAEVKEETYARNMAVNLDANVFLVRHLLPLLRRGHKPRIVIIGSTAAYEPYPLVPTYGIAKWALRGFAMNLRHELSNERIGVTLLSPGGTLTDMWAGEDLPPNRLLAPKDVALMVVAITELTEQAVVDEIVMRPMLGDIHE
jgi:NAD(P)-dependent dehydrogenase (short-subunit alcohol dehydrogenase family)